MVQNSWSKLTCFVEHADLPVGTESGTDYWEICFNFQTGTDFWKGPNRGAAAGAVAMLIVGLHCGDSRLVENRWQF